MNEAAELVDERFVDLIGNVLSTDLRASVYATRRFLPLITAEPMAVDAYENALAVAMMVPSGTRRSWTTRSGSTPRWRSSFVARGGICPRETFRSDAGLARDLQRLDATGPTTGSWSRASAGGTRRSRTRRRFVLRVPTGRR